MIYKRRLYLGGPINGCTDEEANGWRQFVQQDAELQQKYDFLDPMVRDYRGRELEPGIAKEIKRGDLRDIECSDVVLFNCPKPSWGTGQEIFFAHDVLCKPVCIVHPKGVPPSPWLIEGCDVMVNSIQEAIEWLKDDRATRHQ